MDNYGCLCSLLSTVACLNTYLAIDNYGCLCSLLSTVACLNTYLAIDNYGCLCSLLSTLPAGLNVSQRSGHFLNSFAME